MAAVGEKRLRHGETRTAAILQNGWKRRASEFLQYSEWCRLRHCTAVWKENAKRRGDQRYPLHFDFLSKFVSRPSYRLSGRARSGVPPRLAFKFQCTYSKACSNTAAFGRHAQLGTPLSRLCLQPTSIPARSISRHCWHEPPVARPTTNQCESLNLVGCQSNQCL